MAKFSGKSLLFVSSNDLQEGIILNQDTWTLLRQQHNRSKTRSSELYIALFLGQVFVNTLLYHLQNIFFSQ